MEKLRFGMSSCGFQELSLDDFRNLHDAGVQELEISMKYDKYQFIDYNLIKKRADEYGIDLWSFHLPFQPFETNNIASIDKEIREKTIFLHAEYIKRASDIGIRNFVIHPSAEPNREEDRCEMIEYASESLSILSDIAQKEGGVIAVENLPRTCLGRNSAEIKKLISQNGNLRVCFDTNHLLMQSAKDFIKDVGNKIITTHFSDYDFEDEKHWLPGEGKINWTELIEELEKTEYSGPILYEVRLLPPENGSIIRRPLTFWDFKENYDCLVNNRKLKAIGVPL